MMSVGNRYYIKLIGRCKGGMGDVDPPLGKSSICHWYIM